MKSTIYILFSLMAAAVFFFTGCAPREDIIILDQRLAELEALYSSSDEEEKIRVKKLRSQSAGLGVRFKDLQTELQKMNGRLEEIEFAIKKVKKSGEKSDQLMMARFDRLEKEAKANKEHIRSLEKFLDIDGADIKAAAENEKTPGSDNGDKKELSETELYDSARKAFEKNKFEDALDLFQELIKTYPESKNADNAQFWIGEIYYRNKMYKESIIEYQKVIENYSKGNKVKDSMLKQGYAFLKLGDKKNARTLFKLLIKKYPKSSQAKIAKKNLKKIK